MPGINQVNVNPKVGLTFASSLKAFLRQDPDIIMVGEIRDLETAEIAIKAAQTGHLVLSTLHTNDAPQDVDATGRHGCEALRNRHLGQPDYCAATARRNFATTARKVQDIPREALQKEGFDAEDIENGLVIFRSGGLQSCNDGYKGRVGIFQVMEVSEAMGRIIMEGGNAMQIADQAANEGVIDLRRAGLNKVKDGVTSLEEINRVTIE